MSAAAEKPTDPTSDSRPSAPMEWWRRGQHVAVIWLAYATSVAISMRAYTVPVERLTQEPDPLAGLGLFFLGAVGIVCGIPLLLIALAWPFFRIDGRGLLAVFCALGGIAVAALTSYAVNAPSFTPGSIRLAWVVALVAAGVASAPLITRIAGPDPLMTR